MAEPVPLTELDTRYSSRGAEAIDWSEARSHLNVAEVFWLSTVRPDGQPHVTPLLAVWLDGALHFTCGAEERKARNLAQNPHCALTTGHNHLEKGLDLVIEGRAERVEDEARLSRIADAYVSKYGTDWSYDVRDGVFHSEAGGRSLVFAVQPAQAFGFGKGVYSQTRWRFPR